MARIAFLHKSPTEYLGVLSLCAYVTQKGHDVGVFILSEERDHFWDKIREFSPNWVGFSSIVGNHMECFSLARAARDKLGVGTVFGGPYASFYPDCISKEEVDVLIRGEAEEALLEFLNAHDKNTDYSKIPNLWTKRNGHILSNPVRPFEIDLDKYPIPDRIHYYKYPIIRDAHYKFFMTGRGCPFNCYFCFNQEFRKLYNYQGHHVRRHSPEHVLEELTSCKERYPLRRIVFADDIFIIQQSWLASFLPLYRKKIGVPFSCNVRADILNEDVVRLLSDNGCDYVQLGLESGSLRVRNEILGKNITNEQFYGAVELLHRYEIPIRTFNIIGSPTETLEEALQTMELNSRAKIEYPTCALYQPYQGTRTDTIARELGYLNDSFSMDDLTGSVYTKSDLNQPEIKELERVQKLFYLGARNHHWIPVIRWLVRHNFDSIFNLVFFITFAIRYMRESGNSLLNTIMIGVRYFTLNKSKHLDRFLN